MENLYGSICLSDIPKEFIRTANNGKKYLSIAVNVRRSVGQDGETHYIKVLVPKEQQQANVTHYIGNLKPSKIQPQPQQQGYYQPQQGYYPQQPMPQPMPQGYYQQPQPQVQPQPQPQQGNFESLNDSDNDLPF